MRSLSLDPSIENVGWSLFDSTRPTRDQAWEWGTFKLEGGNLETRITHLIQLIQLEIGEFDFLITEKPAFFSSERGQIAAHQNYTIDLAAIAFYVAGWFHKDHRYHQAITASAWKGSVPKAVTSRKFFRCWPKIVEGSLSEHAIDATMLHYFWLTNFAQAKPPSLIGNLQEYLPKLILPSAQSFASKNLKRRT